LLCFCRSTAKNVADIKLSSMKGVYHGIGQQIVSLLSVRHIWITATSAAIHEVPIRRSDFGMACWVANVKAIVTSLAHVGRTLLSLSFSVSFWLRR
jgi:hypothetical protein